MSLQHGRHLCPRSWSLLQSKSHSVSVSLQHVRPLCLRSLTLLQSRSYYALCPCSMADLIVCVPGVCCNRRAVPLCVTAAWPTSLSAFMESAAIEKPFRFCVTAAWQTSLSAFMESAAIKEPFRSVSLQNGRPLCLRSWNLVQLKGHSALCHCSMADLFVCVHGVCCNRRAIPFCVTAARQTSLSAFMESAAIEEPFRFCVTAAWQTSLSAFMKSAAIEKPFRFCVTTARLRCCEACALHF